MLTANLIDEATIGLIHKFFGLRVICDDVNFSRFYERQLDLVLPRYNKLLRFENTEFDALVNEYRERQLVGNASENSKESSDIEKTDAETRIDAITRVRTPNLTDTDISTETGEYDKNGTRTPDLTDSDTVSETTSNGRDITRTPDITVEENSENVSSSSSSSDSTSSSDGTTASTNNNVSVAKQNPQSISYQGTAVGSVPDLDWQYPSSQQQGHSESESTSSNSSTSDNDTSTTGRNEGQTSQTTTGTEHTVEEADGEKSQTGTHTHTGTETNDEDGTDSRSRSATHTETGAETTTENRTGNKNVTGLQSGEIERSKVNNSTARERWTGRTDLTPQQALTTAMAYIKQSSAFVWLKEELEICFLSCYDI
jgi:hypothetical protein